MNIKIITFSILYLTINGCNDDTINASHNDNINIQGKFCIGMTVGEVENIINGKLIRNFDAILFTANPTKKEIESTIYSMAELKEDLVILYFNANDKVIKIKPVK